MTTKNKTRDFTAETKALQGAIQTNSEMLKSLNNKIEQLNDKLTKSVAAKEEYAILESIRSSRKELIALREFVQPRLNDLRGAQNNLLDEIRVSKGGYDHFAS